MRVIVGPQCRNCRKEMKRIEQISDITGYPHGKWVHEDPNNKCLYPDVDWEVRDE